MFILVIGMLGVGESNIIETNLFPALRGDRRRCNLEGGHHHVASNSFTQSGNSEAGCGPPLSDELGQVSFHLREAWGPYA